MKLLFLSLLLSTQGLASVDYETARDLRSRAVKVISAVQGHGSGTILRSTPEGSTILTNRHICKLLVYGGSIATEVSTYQVVAFILSQQHDLCLVKVAEDLEVDTAIAEHPASLNEVVYVSGFPWGLPNMVMMGIISDPGIARIPTGTYRCTAEQMKYNFLQCMARNGQPIVEVYETTNTTIMIAPGNSGSGVYNVFGQVVAVVFASYSRQFSPGLLVPHGYIKAFLEQEVESLEWTLPNPQGNTAKIEHKPWTAFSAIESTEIDNLYKRLKQ